MSSTKKAPEWAPHDGQREFLESEAKIKVLACGRRWGKTDACAASIVNALYRDAPTKHVILAPTLDQARLLFDRVLEMLSMDVGAPIARKTRRKSGAGSPHSKGQDPSPPAPSPRHSSGRGGSRKSGSTGLPDGAAVRYSPHPRLTYLGHQVTARSGYLGRLLRGNEASHIVVDEAAFVPEDLITEVAMPMLATTGGQLTLISTPRGKNHFWRFFEMGQKGEHGVWSRRARSCESPHVKGEYLKIQKDIISERAYLVEYDAEFVEAAGRIFRTEAIDDCLVGVLPRPAKGPYAIGVDFGRYRDYTAVAVVCGSQDSAMLVEIDRVPHLSMSEQLVLVANIVARYPAATVVCDATGLQDRFVDELRDKGLRAGIRGFVFTAQTKGPLIDGLASMIDHRRLSMRPHPELLRELEHFEAKVTEHGNTQYMGVSGYHDDLVVALALAITELRSGPPPRLLVGTERQFFMSR